MSGLFKSAAMTLLSKTLQTLLYKYLSDVDVEGVALPSLYDTDGQSGWGVRLSNVKLRDGAKLMDLPGKLPPRQRKRQQSKPKKKKASKRKNTLSREVPGSEQGGEHENATTTTSKTTTFSTGGVAPAGDAQSTATESTSATTVPSTENNSNNNPSAQPAPLLKPEIKSQSSWFSWYYTPSTSNIKDEPNERTDVAPVTSESVEDPPGKEKERPGEHVQAESEAIDTDESGELDDDPDDAEPDEANEAETLQIDDGPIPMLLRLGAGRIGTLDVRLVGRDLHVLVQDGDLTIEVIPLNKHDQSSATSAKDANPGSTTASRNDAEPTKDEKAAAPTPASPPPKKPTPQPEAVADRILAENGLARIFSVLPNLLLRDIRLRIVIRDESFGGESGELDPNDSVVEISIELLSITDGQDFFANFRTATGQDDAEDHAPDTDADLNQRNTRGTINESASANNLVLTSPRHEFASVTDGQLQQNDFLTKRIRTGRGLDGGIVLRIFPGYHFSDQPAIPTTRWARHEWLDSAEHCVLRCSGLDVQARIFLGTRDELHVTLTDESQQVVSSYDEYILDSMLFAGVDYIVPGPDPLPPLPPIAEKETFAGNAEGEQHLSWELPEATTFHLDKNGVQSSSLATSFHRLARGMKPHLCGGNHLPGEYCNLCWETFPGAPREHPNDAAAPLGGLVVHISLRDVLEVNIDRPALDVLGLLIKLFKKHKAASGADQPQKVEIDKSTTTTPAKSEASLKREGSSLSLGRSVHSETNNLTAAESRESEFGNDVTTKEDRPATPAYLRSDTAGDTNEAFPRYMQPEKIQYLGLHVASIQCRVHAMRENRDSDSSLAFCYWDLSSKCCTADIQKLNADDVKFLDCRLDIGHLLLTERSGMRSRDIISLGLRQRVVDFDDATIETMMTREEDCKRPPWPSTAAVLLDLPPPLETLIYETRDRHAVQLRFVSVEEVQEVKNHRTAIAHCKFGATSADFALRIIGEIRQAIREARLTLLGEIPPAIPVDPPPLGSMIRYKLDLDGARVHLDPFLNVRLPLSSFSGVLTSCPTMSIEALLERISLQYTRNGKPSVSTSQRLSLQKISDLPDNLRLRILIFLDDLTPLGRALGLKLDPQTSWLHHPLVNKQITKIARKLARNPQTKKSSENMGESPGMSRRQRIMNELLRLDDDALEELWNKHNNNDKPSNGKKKAKRYVEI